ncbi:enoyl-CoA hydratase-related protein [Sneathiella marina]|uniref:Enoyl-CoA hydratase-related protein n=1 Tax=Sneathiella marina TaxID=2950108 RepID=A0ABY4W1E9_9PROT|nr:enoyl-CoA hydratase-related protein [Sneathiella marina]USG60988.1 enoyl-CoA hydratase-related protein [Sneathiella marina]
MVNLINTTIEDTPDGAIALITIDNQRKANTLNSAAIGDLNRSLSELHSNPDIALVILTGAGDKVFIGGADIKEMSTLNTESARTFITNLHHVCHKIRYLHAPVIARVNGLALGAGMEIAAVCDMVVACQHAAFAMPEVRVGIPSVIDAALLPRILGAGLARDLVMTGRMLSAADARVAGFVQRLAEETTLDEEIQTVIDEILAGGRQAISLQKQLCNDWENNPLASGIQIGIETFAHSYDTAEPKTMMERFLNRDRSG